MKAVYKAHPFLVNDMINPCGRNPLSLLLTLLHLAVLLGFIISTVTL